MRIQKKGKGGVLEGDLTPMIDMTFQLIAFFMLVINFSDVEQDQRIHLPASELAQPPDAPYDHPLTIHLTRADKFIYGGGELPALPRLRSSSWPVSRSFRTNQGSSSLRRLSLRT